jgi:hypothetical protein
MESILEGNYEAHVPALGRCAYSHMYCYLTFMVFRTALVPLVAHMCWQGCLDICKLLSRVGNTAPPKMSWLLWTLISSSHIYVLAGWEGSAHDALILVDAIERNDGFIVPPGNCST